MNREKPAMVAEIFDAHPYVIVDNSDAGRQWRLKQAKWLLEELGFEPFPGSGLLRCLVGIYRPGTEWTENRDWCNPTS